MYKPAHTYAPMMMKVSVLALAFVSSISVTYGQFRPARSARCSNPNGRSGTCVSMYDCQTILSVLQRRSVNSIDVAFVKASECFDGIGSGPYVCCSSDTGFLRQPTNQLNQGDDFADSFNWESPQSTLLLPNSQYSGRGQRFGGTTRFVDDAAPRESRGSGTRLRSVAPVSTLLPQPPACGGITIQNKILGGRDADLYEFPWMVLFEYRRDSGEITSNCAGSLINQRYVLTAAHCVKGAIEKEIGRLVSIRLGEHDVNQQIDCNQSNQCAPEAIQVGIEQTIPHERYVDKSKNKEHDIALVRLDRNVRFSDSIQPICLGSVMGARSAAQSGGKVKYTVAGWGRTLRSLKSVVKQKLDVTEVAQEQCQRRFASHNVQIVDSQLCAGGKFAQDSCLGDSGGPLMRFRNGAWVLEGIVSFGFKCGLVDWPAVHTRVANYDDWIRSRIRE